MKLQFPVIDLKARLIAVVAILLYRFCLDVAYFNFSADFAYYGIVWEPRGLLEIVTSWLVVALMAIVTPLSTKKPSHSLHLLLLLVCFIPTSTHYALNQGHSAGFFFGLAGVFFCVPFVHQLLGSRLKFAGTGLNQRWFLFTLITIFAGLLGIVMAKYGFKTSVTSLTDVYDQRASFKAQSGRLSIYTLDWLANVVNLFVALYAVKHRRYLMLGFSLLLSLYLFSIGGHKSFLFVAPFTIAIYAIYRISHKRFNLLLILGLCVFVAVMVSIDQFSSKGYTLASSLFIRRSLLLPSQIYYHYCEYFTEYGINLFSQNIPFKFFISSPYNEKLPSLVGKAYFTFKDDIYANGNVFADTYAQVGWFSYMLLSVLLPFLYVIIDWVSAEKYHSIAVPFLLMAGHTLLNSGLIVTLITHGFLLALALMWLSPTRIRRVFIKPKARALA